MNVLARFDESLVIGYLKSANSNDPDILRARQQSLISSMQMGRVIAIWPMVIGCMAILAGIPLLLILVGIIPIAIGSAFVYGSVWCRKRLAANIATTQSAYAKYMN